MIRALLFFLLAMSLISAKEKGEVEKTSVVILGGGVGGLTSAVYLGQAGIKPLVLEGLSPGGAIAQSHHVRNWPGEIEISGSKLAENMRKQALESGASIRSEEAISVDFKTRPFVITTRDLRKQTRKIHADAVIIAMGSTPNRLGVKGEQEHFGKGVYTCATCDGPLYKGKTVAVVGGGESALTEIDYLSGLASKVYLLVRKETLRAALDDYKKAVLARSNIEILYSTSIEEIKEGSNGSLALSLKSPKQKTLTVDALFLGIGARPNTALFKDQLQLKEEGYIALKNDQETSVPGVFAIGDIIDPVYKQAVVASGDGAKAAFQVRPLIKKNLNPEASAMTTKTEGVIREFHSSNEFDQYLKEEGKPLLIDFYATWCGPCKAFSSTFDALAVGLAHKFRFGKVNIDEVGEIVKKYGIKELPTLIWVNEKGEVIQRKSGLDQISEMIQKIEQEEVTKRE